MKIKNALPKKEGTINGLYVLIHCSFWKMIYWGIRRICPGSINVAIMHAKAMPLPLKRILENPYATMAEVIVTPTVAMVVTKTEFLKKVANVIPPKPFHPLI